MDLEFKQLPKDRIIDTVFWGGGTPGLLAAKDLERLGQSMLKNLSQAPREWTIEMAPSTVKADKLRVLKALGVTRISMGVQSFDSKLLESLGRLHNPKQIYTAWERIQEADFKQTNLDLIFAIPNQSLDQWAADIHEASKLQPDHISTYCLTFEEDTALYVKLAEGKIRIDEARELKFYQEGWALLEKLGYTQYEISNFAKPGMECVHNLNTWRMHEWIGCGPSAASQYNGERYQRPANLDVWIEGMVSGKPIKDELVVLNDLILLADSIVFGLRMNEGIDLNELKKRYSITAKLEALDALLDRLITEELLEDRNGRLSLSSKGQVLCDAIGTKVLEAIG